MAARGCLWLGAHMELLSNAASDQGTTGCGPECVLRGHSQSLSSPGVQGGKAEVVERCFYNWLDYFVISTWQRGRPHLRRQPGG